MVATVIPREDTEFFVSFSWTIIFCSTTDAWTWLIIFWYFSFRLVLLCFAVAWKLMSTRTSFGSVFRGNVLRSGVCLTRASGFALSNWWIRFASLVRRRMSSLQRWIKLCLLLLLLINDWWSFRMVAVNNSSSLQKPWAVSKICQPDQLPYYRAGAIRSKESILFPLISGNYYSLVCHWLINWTDAMIHTQHELPCATEETKSILLIVWRQRDNTVETYQAWKSKNFLGGK